MHKLGEKIRTLRKQKNLSQEVLAQYLGVSFQAVSKWETGTTLPDVTMIPAIASFFGVSTDELFDFHLYEVQRDVEAIVDAHRRIRDDKPACEALLRDGLRKYPGNEILLNCLVGVLPLPERAEEVIPLCRSLAESTRDDEIRIDAWRIMAEAYASLGEHTLAADAIGHIPEIYFTKLEITADLLDGEARFAAAARQKALSFEGLLRMCTHLAKHYESIGEREKALLQVCMARDILLAVREDVPTPYTSSLWDGFGERMAEMEAELVRLAEK